MKKNGIYTLGLILIVVGGLNRGLVGFLNFDLVAAIFGDMTIISRIVYSLVGISALYILAEQLGMLKK
ncbi:MAG TPA: DUF378 domain-containing protein [Candidatus Absconditabacterales bacterium]|nr:DUF378 domain-containing protein [Candidatus Absconditabacterales bacterium]